MGSGHNEIKLLPFRSLKKQTYYYIKTRKIMKNVTYLLLVLFLLVLSGTSSNAQQTIINKGDLSNKLTQKEISDGWQLLWDGKSNTGWRSYDKPTFPESGWEMKDGILSVLPPQDNKSGGDIITIKAYKNFELVIDFMYTPGANSGIKYFIDGKTNVGCEYQLLDDKLHPDAKLGINGNRTLAGLYDLIPPKKDKKDNGPDNWNTAKIIVKGNHVEHWLNGQMTVSYERGDSAWKALVATSKFKGSPNFGEAAEGHILLQDHEFRISFKNLKIREIK
jgi:hypothetical protein